MKDIGQNIMTSEMVDELYKKENVGKDIFEKKIEELEKKQDKLMPKAEDRLMACIFGTDSDRKKLDKQIEDNQDKANELREKKETYKEYAAKRRLVDTGHGLGNTRIYPSKNLRNEIVEKHLYLCDIYAKIFYNQYKCKIEYDELWQTAALGLINAAKYYVPNDTAKFTTYASRCIENMIKNTYDKKVKTNKLSFDELLIKTNMLLMYLEIIKSYRFRKPRTFREEHRLIEHFASEKTIYQTKEMNEALALSGYAKYSINIRKTMENSKRGLLQTLITKLYNEINRKTKISQIIDSEERNIISLELSQMNVSENRKEYETIELFIKRYLNRLVNLIIYNKTCRELIKNKELITDDKIIKKANEYIHNINKTTKELKERYRSGESWSTLEEDCGIILYSDRKLMDEYEKAYEKIFAINSIDSKDVIEYYNQIHKENPINDKYLLTKEIYLRYKLNTSFDESKKGIKYYIDYGSEFRNYESLNPENKNYEVDLESILIGLMYFSPLGIENGKTLLDVVDPSIEEALNQAMETDNLEEKSRLIKYMLTRFKELNVELNEKDEKLRELYISTYMEKAKEQVNNQIEYKKRRKEIIEKNHELLIIGILGKLKLRKFDEDTLAEVRKFNQTNKELEVYIDEDLDKKEYEPRQTLEEEYEAKTFIRDYEKCLSKLSPQEQDVLNLWLDEEFKHSYSSKEIAQILDTKSTEVVDIKNKAFQKIRNNPIMQKYKDNFIE